MPVSPVVSDEAAPPIGAVSPVTEAPQEPPPDGWAAYLKHKAALLGSQALAGAGGMFAAVPDLINTAANTNPITAGYDALAAHDPTGLLSPRTPSTRPQIPPLIPNGYFSKKAEGLVDPVQPQGALEDIQARGARGLGATAASVLTGRLLRLPAMPAPARTAGDVLAAQPVRQAVTNTAVNVAPAVAGAAGADPSVQRDIANTTALLLGFSPGATSGTGTIRGQWPIPPPVPGVIPQAPPNLAQIARDTHGIPIAPGQIGNGLGKFLYDGTGKIPGTGSVAFTERQRNAYNAAVARRFGGTTQDGKITLGDGGTIDTAQDDLGQRFERLATSAAGPPDQQLLNDLSGIHDRAGALEAPTVQRRIDTLLDVAAHPANGGNLPGAWVGPEVSSKSPAALGMKAGGTVEQPLWADYRNALLDWVERNPNVDTDAWQTARRQYRNLMIAKGSVNGAGDVQPGVFSIAATRNAKLPNPDPQMLELGNIGRDYIKPPPSSGTAERGLAYAGLGSVGTLVGENLMTGDIQGALMKAAGLGSTYGAAQAIQRGLRAGSMAPPPPGRLDYYARQLLAMPPQQEPGQ